MPVSATSRYQGLPVLQVEDARRGPQPAIALRPPPDPVTTPLQHQAAALDNLELLSWQYLGQSDSFWRIADANPLRFPFELRPGEKLSIPATSDPTLVTRSRKF
jgi:hypothetical protein